MSFDIGPMGNLEGKLPGLDTLSAVTSGVVPAVAVAGMQRRQRRKAAGKDFNDEAVDTTVGTDAGRAVKDPGAMAAD